MADSSHAQNTARAYAADWRDFEGWCRQQGFLALPAAPETVALYLRALEEAGRRSSTLRRRLAAIAWVHGRAGWPAPTTGELIRDVLDDVRQAEGLRRASKAPLLARDLRRKLDRLPDTLAGRRDRALLLVGFGGGLRRSELVALDVDDLAFRPDALALRAAPVGREIVLPRGAEPERCAVAATEAWIATAGIDSGPLFRPVTRSGRVRDTRLSDKAVALVVKRAAEGAGLDPARYAAHSLRSGAALSALLEEA